MHTQTYIHTNKYTHIHTYIQLGRQLQYSYMQILKVVSEAPKRYTVHTQPTFKECGSSAKQTNTIATALDTLAIFDTQ